MISSEADLIDIARTRLGDAASSTVSSKVVSIFLDLDSKNFFNTTKKYANVTFSIVSIGGVPTWAYENYVLADARSVPVLLNLQTIEILYDEWIASGNSGSALTFINTLPESQIYTGWTPVLVQVPLTGKTVLKLQTFVGGEGDLPSALESKIGKYKKADGTFTDNVALAIDIAADLKSVVQMNTDTVEVLADEADDDRVAALAAKAAAESARDTATTKAAEAANSATIAANLTNTQQINDVDQTAYVIVDNEGKIALRILKDGTIQGKFDISKIQLLYENLPSLLKEIVPVQSDINFIDYLYAILDSEGKIGLALGKDGKVKGKFDLSQTPVLYENLSAQVQNSLPSFNNDNWSGYAYAILDNEGKVAFGITYEGKVIARIQLNDNSVSYQALDSSVKSLLPNLEFLRINAANSSDYEYGEDDELWRGIEFEIPVKTALNGYFFERFPNIKTKTLQGLNNTGTAIQIRDSAGLVIRGKKYISTFDPGTDGSLNGLLYNPCDFWNVTAAGTFLDLTLAIGDRLIYNGYQANSGTNFPKFIKQRAGEFFCMGEANPSTFTPSSTKDYDLYIVSTDGTYSSISLVVGDYLVYKGGWGKVSGNLRSIANGEFFTLGTENANKFSVRRTDKSNTQVSVRATGYRTSLKRRVNNDFVLYSDSMFGVKVGASIQTLLTGRTATTQSFGGGRSIDVLTMVQKRIRETDLYAGRIHAFWHGQNNNTDLVQIKNCSLQMATLASTFQSRFIFWSMLGSLSSTFNGSRIVQANHEDAFNNANNSRFIELENWYEAVFPSKWFSPRTALLQAASIRTRKHLQFPGLTEAQAASTYGVLPLSYFFDYTTVSWNPDTLNFLGYHNVAGLPTGGANNDYYIRSGNGTIGQIIVNVTGTWIEYAHDVTHLTQEGADAVALKFVAFLTLNNY